MNFERRSGITRYNTMLMFSYPGIEYIIFDADNLIDKLIKYQCSDFIEILPGTQKFILDFYDALENYRKEKEADDFASKIVLSKILCNHSVLANGRPSFSKALIQFFTSTILE